MKPISFTPDQLLPEDRAFVFRWVSCVNDYESYFKDDPHYQEICDLLIKLAYFKTKGYVIFKQMKLSDGSLAWYHKVKEGIEFDEWDYMELNGGGLCLTETYKKYGLKELEPILEKY